MTSLLRIVVLVLASLPAVAGAQSLIFSEYIEGSSNNKALEILNTTAAPFDLGAAGITVQLHFNGNPVPPAGNTFALTGVVAAGDVYVIAHSSAVVAVTGQADLLTANLTFNGDDAIVLRSGGPAGPVLDVIGDVGFDPGTEWGTGVTSTADNTLIRQADACTGDTIIDDDFNPAVDYDGFAVDTFTGLGNYTGTCVAGGAATSVQFASASATAGEASGTFTLQVSVTNPSETVATTFDVAFLAADPGTTGSAGDIGGFSTVSVIAPAGATSASVDVTITNDAEAEPTETFVFRVQNVAGGTNAGVGAQETFTLSIADDDTPVADFVVINEFDADTPGDDVAEFVELFDGGAGGTDLSGLVLVLFNGGSTSNPSYAAFDLDGFATDAGGRFLAGNTGVPGVQLVFPSNTLQNGADALALYVGDAANWPNGTAPTTAGLIDAVAYGTADARDTDLLVALGLTIQFDESYEAPSAGQSLQRLNVDLAGSHLGGVPTYSGLLYALAPSPNAANAALVTVDRTSQVADLAGWRLLSSPVVRADLEFLQVGDYAGINLVQGVPAGAVNVAQYPAAGDNLLNQYLGNGSFAGPANTDEVLPPGEGFFWYWYDQDITPPDPTGTSVSFDLSNPAFDFAVTGLPVDDHLNGIVYGTSLPVSADGFYMVGNPFAYPYRLGGATVGAGTLSSNFYAYDPALATYVVLTADFANPYAGAAVPIWNGVMAEVSGLPGGTTFVPFTSSSAYVDPMASDSFVGLAGAALEGEARLDLALDLIRPDGEQPVDRATVIRFRDDAETGWDRHDGSKPMPPQPVGLMAPVGERDGESRRQAVLSLPAEFGARVDVPVAFLATTDGSWRVSMNGSGIPEEWSVHLVDNATGATTDLRTTTYEFDAPAGDWSERFTLSVSSVVTDSAPAPDEAFLSAATPNPASGRATFTLRVGATQHVRADVFDALGRRVATLLDGTVLMGAQQSLTFHAGALAPGAYVVRVAGETFSASRRVTVVR